MKLLVEILTGVAACGSAYYLALQDFAPKGRVTHSVVRQKADVNGERPHLPDVPSPIRSAVIEHPTRAVESVDAGQNIEQKSSMAILRNEVIRATAEDMHRRSEDVLKCLDGVQLAGPEKIRFSVEVVSTPVEAATGRWRFVEIVDGEPLPESFASCATRTFGGGHHLVPPKDFHFPQYSGDLAILYTIPAPPAD